MYRRDHIRSRVLSTTDTVTVNFLLLLSLHRLDCLWFVQIFSAQDTTVIEAIRTCLISLLIAGEESVFCKCGQQG